MKKSIAFLLASLAASSSILFNTLEANAFAKTTKTKIGNVKECRPGNDIFVLENQGGKFKISFSFCLLFFKNNEYPCVFFLIELLSSLVKKERPLQLDQNLELP